MAGRADEAVERLTAEILTARLEPGMPLREHAQAARLRISRNTFREVIGTLAGRGLVRRAPNKGAVVASLTSDDIADLYRLRRVFELTAISRARGRPVEAFHPVGAALDRLAGAIERRDEIATIEADLTFHSAIVGLHGSPRLSRAFATCLVELRLALAMLNARDRALAGLLDEHRSLYALLVAGDVDRCGAALADHLDESELRVKQSLPR